MKCLTILVAAGALASSTTLSQCAEFSIGQTLDARCYVEVAEPCLPAYRPLGFRHFAGTVTYVPGFSYGQRRYCRRIAVYGRNGRRYIIRRCF
jgi:hypothetical protein